MHAILRVLLNKRSGSNEKMPHRDMFLSKSTTLCDVLHSCAWQTGCMPSV